MKYFIRPFGCQMNKHDAERVAGVLQLEGMSPAAEPGDADVIVVLTCAVRENAEERLRGQVSSMKVLKSDLSSPIIAVGGCIAQRDRERLLSVLPHVDVVFGTHNIGSLPDLIRSAMSSDGPAIEILEEGTSFASDLPSEREHDYHAWLPITVGCNNFCTYCIVPYVRGRERSRSLEDIRNEAAELVRSGVKEITLLGQNVNSYGRDLYGEPRFPEVLRAVAESGVPRIGFATSHPKDLSEETLEAMATIPSVLRHLHLPVQSGSSSVLESMNRTYNREQYLALVDRIYDMMPDISLTTDIIVGFPGETDTDFEDTVSLAESVRFDQAFTFIYSPREGTPAAEYDCTVPRAVSQERIERLVSIVQRTANEKNQSLVGTTQRVLVEGPSKKDPSLYSGKTHGAKLVHFSPITVAGTVTSGDLVDVRIDEAHTWYLLGTVQG